MEHKVWERMWPPQTPYDYNRMGLKLALEVIEGAKKKSEAMGFATTNAVCDAAGNLTAIQRMDDAPLLSLEIARNKARSAVYGKIPTFFWGDSFKGAAPELPPLFFHSDWIAFMGGFPIIMDGKIIGGLGCSGATWKMDRLQGLAWRPLALIWRRRVPVWKSSASPKKNGSR